MRVPMSWLRELVDIDAPTEEIAERLSLSGTSVESIDRPEVGVSGVVVAKVVEVSEIPEARKPMWQAQVDAGPAGRFQVVAGAQVAAGDVVPFAQPGARVTTLPEALGVRTMLGSYESHGMLCSSHELGLSEDHSGIMRLGPGAELGADVARVLGLDDEILELEVTANRSDLLSMVGVAREVSVLYDAPLRIPSFDVTEEADEASAATSVQIEDPHGCPRYLARVVTGVTFGPSPAWVQARLSRCDIRPLGNLVDATNYVLELTGQPLHAFDLDALAEERIIVRRARSGERLVTLDDVERKLTEEDLVIADAESAQALAGIMGGAASEVGATTQRVLIESAHFDPRTIYRTARRVDLRTGASQRFEKGTDPQMVAPAAALCADLMRRWAGGSVARGAVDSGGVEERPTIRLRTHRTDLVLGHAIPAPERGRILTGLGCEISTDGGDTDVQPPTWRPDLEREIDLIEELVRLHGYDKVPMHLPTGARGFLTKTQHLRRRVRDVLLGAGLSEATLLSLVSDRHLAVVDADAPVEVANPMSQDQAYLRPSLVPGLIDAAGRNAARGRRDVRLFEMGTVFVGWAADADLPAEAERVGFVISGAAGEESWHTTDRRDVDIFDAKGIVEVLFEEIGVSGWSLRPSDAAPFHPGRSAEVLIDGGAVGRFGEVRPSVRDGWDVPGGLVVGEFDLIMLFDGAPDERLVRDVPRLPPVLRDIAFVVGEDAPAADLRQTILASAGAQIESVLLVDVYRGDPIPEGHKSLAFRLTFRAPDRTLTAEEADAARENVVRALIEQHGAEIR